jgi:hypothetical protein
MLKSADFQFQSRKISLGRCANPRSTATSLGPFVTNSEAGMIPFVHAEEIQAFTLGGENGFIAPDLTSLVARVQTLIQNPALLAAMRTSARAHALSASWDNVFDSVYSGYERGLRNGCAAGKKIRLRPSAGVCATNVG